MITSRQNARVKQAAKLRQRRQRSRQGRFLQIEDVDVLDGTPLLDIKPYVSRFDSRADSRNGWQGNVDEATARARGRRNYDGDSD